MFGEDSLYYIFVREYVSFSTNCIFVEAQLLSNYGVTYRPTYSLTHNAPLRFFGHISVVCGSIWTFFYEFAIYNFVNQAINNGFKAHSRVFKERGGGWILSDFREPFFRGPCWPCYINVSWLYLFLFLFFFPNIIFYLIITYI